MFALWPDKTSDTYIKFLNKHKYRGVSPSVFAIGFENATKQQLRQLFHNPEITDATFI
jgi:hypothetical protein